MGGAKTTSEKHRSLALRSRSIRRRSSLRACRGSNHNAADHQRRQNNVHPGRVQMQCGGQRHLEECLVGYRLINLPQPDTVYLYSPLENSAPPGPSSASGYLDLRRVNVGRGVSPATLRGGALSSWFRSVVPDPACWREARLWRRISRCWRIFSRA